MKILHVLGFYPEIGGPFFCMKELFAGLLQEGIKVKILSPLPHNYNLDNLKTTSAMFSVKYINEEFFFSKFIRSFSFKWWKILKSEIKDVDIIVVHGIFDYYTVLTYLLNRREGKPIILFPHGSLIQEAFQIKSCTKKNIYMEIIGKKFLQKCTAICVRNIFEKEEIKNIVGSTYEYLQKKIFVIPYGINLLEFEKLPEKNTFKSKYPTLKDRKYILFLSRLSTKKRIDLIIDAFKKLTGEYMDLFLVIAGPDDEGYGNKVKGKLKNMGLLERTIFTGMLLNEDKMSAFVDAELFVLPSHSENFGIAVIESMACGTPIVISNKLGISKSIEENRAGVVVNLTPDDVYKGIKLLLDNQDYRREVVENGKRIVKEFCNTKQACNDMVELFKKILDK